MVTAKAHRKWRATYDTKLIQKGLPNQQYDVVLQVPRVSPKTIIPENVKVKNTVFTMD